MNAYAHIKKPLSKKGLLGFTHVGVARLRYLTYCYLTSISLNYRLSSSYLYVYKERDLEVLSLGLKYN